MTTYVLIPGACHGAWCFDDLAAGLRNEGHRVLSYTLTGVAERAHLAHSGVNLETHITDVLSALASEPDAKDLVLVGHSYGGMVISAVADRIPEKVDALVYLDALVPRDGESCWHLVNDEQRQDGSTAEMVFDCFQQVSHLSEAFTLEPGDVIATGTPAGIGASIQPFPEGLLKVGDTVRIEIDGIGELRNEVIAEPQGFLVRDDPPA